MRMRVRVVEKVTFLQPAVNVDELGLPIMSRRLLRPVMERKRGAIELVAPDYGDIVRAVSDSSIGSMEPTSGQTPGCISRY